MTCGSVLFQGTSITGVPKTTNLFTTLIPHYHKASVTTRCFPSLKIPVKMYGLVLMEVGLTCLIERQAISNILNTIPQTLKVLVAIIYLVFPKTSIIIYG